MGQEPDHSVSGKVRTSACCQDRTVHENRLRLLSDETAEGEVMKQKKELTKRSLVARLRAPISGDFQANDKLDAIGEALAYLIEKTKMKRSVRKAVKQLKKARKVK
jgi:hypothetical protein